MITSQGENIEFTLYHRKPNTAYEYEDTPALIFYGRLANNIEKKQYRILQGVNGSNESVFVLVSNLPSEVKIGDRIKYLDKLTSVVSTGYYLDKSRIVNFKVMNNQYIISRSPKGIV